MKGSTDFVELLNLSGQNFSHVSLDGILISIYDFVSRIWESPRLYTFVDHGIEHSYRVLQIALNIFEKISSADQQLSPLERLILGIGSLVHDVGMQYNKYPRDGIEKNPIEIRENHCELGFEMIRDTREGTFNTQRSGPILSLEEHHKTFLHYGALVGFSHSGSKYWESLKQTMYDPKKEGGLQLLRLRLLSALLRLADELHCEYTRVPELNWINTPLLNEKEKAHWVACYYVQEIGISSPGTAGLRMIMKWRIQEKATNEDTQLIRTLLQELRENKINQESELVKDYLKLEEGTEPYFIEFKISPIPEIIGIQDLPLEVKKFIKESLRPYQFGVKVLSPLPKVKELSISSPNLDTLKYTAQDFLLTGKGIISGHFRLKTGWHTNKYVRCRELCSDIDFIGVLCQELSRFYSQYAISDVLAIGTSAIRIGSLLSFLLSARMSYTFEDAKIESPATNKKDYTDYEKNITPFDNGNILIIDDILGVGSVLHDVISQLKTLSNPPKQIRVFTLYSLGDVKTLGKDFSDIDVDYLVSFTDVEYKKEDKNSGACELCRERPEIIKIEE
jgi:orotate phosphoribosyltransferase